MRIRSFVLLPLLAAGFGLATEARAQDPRIGLTPGGADAGQAAQGMKLVAAVDKPEGFRVPPGVGGVAAILWANSDLAFQGDLVFVGNFSGFNVYDISDPANPKLETSFACPGGQGDLSVYGDLLFMSVEMPNGRIDCTEGGFNPATMEAADPQRFRGVRIFDISDIHAPKQVAQIQTCRGSHTHTLVTDPDDDDNVYLYVSGVSYVRPAEELAGCVGTTEDPNTSLFRIEVIKVPVDHPEDAEIVSMPRIFANLETGAVGGLWEGGSHGPDTQETARTDQCHDITAYPELGIAAGACSGNGILLDISDPANPVRTAAVSDPNFAYWHSATFNNDATKVLFTDEWGGGVEARCRETDPKDWGADAIFTRASGSVDLAGYYKLPVVQTPEENCVAHNGSLIPVPGRDIMAQAWYQGGISVFDFTDPAHPVEIAYFDRGPLNAESLELGGQWSAYWYNGNVYGSEIGRGLDVLELVPTDQLSQNEIDAAKLVHLDRLNVQTQRRIEWPASPAVARALLDQLLRDSDHAAPLQADFERAMALQDGDAREGALGALADQAEEHAGMAPAAAKRLEMLAATLREMAEEAN